MKKLIAILMSCSLALCASAIAQQEEQQQKPKKEKAQPAKSHQANEAKPAPNPQSVPRQHMETKASGHEKGQQPNEPSYKQHTATKVPGKEPGHTNAGREQIEQRNKEGRAPNESETETANKPPGPAPATEREQYNSASGAPQANRPNAQTNKLNAQAKKPDPQAIQAIKTQHASFRAQPKPDKVPAATFNQNYRISGSEQWQGPQYEVFRSYHPEWHDQGWYRSHYNRVELIGGGYYYWNNGYWFPAWGYDPSAQYYAYDAPIYVGSRAEPPDRVIADVQSALQQMGYYQGEVDGLLGPLTREALTAYQTDHGLYTTAVIDEPTLSSLGMG
jgi:Putative peptidoglycan binding domain